ncbi:hypothetical protein C2S52_011842 [Perilla frutescens var. hirtella]|nr:hypothetical protein C2S52_011842 [Perilla frutescens var. hirtella]
MMNSYAWILPVFVFLSIWNIVDVHAQRNKFIVTNFGAVADGETDSKQAFANAWKKACETRGGVVSVPAGKSFFVSGGDFVGPCNGRTIFQVDGTVVASDNDPKMDDSESWITFEEVDNLKVVGKGVFDGNGASSWSRCASSDCGNRPAVSVVIRGISSRNSKMFHFQIHKATNLRVTNVNITAPAESPNTDGIHISNSWNVQIRDSLIGTGDDCVSLGDGSKNVNITGVTCGPGHGISIGSLGKYKGEEDVSGITVTKCHLMNTDNGLRIKTWAPSQSSTVVSNITFSDITLTNVMNPIIIDQHYCPDGDCNSNGEESSVQIKGVKYINIRGSSASEKAINMQCSETMPCKDVVFSRVELSYISGNRGRQRPTTTVAACSNISGTRFYGSNPSSCSSTTSD